MKYSKSEENTGEENGAENTDVEKTEANISDEKVKINTWADVFVKKEDSQFKTAIDEGNTMSRDDGVEEEPSRVLIVLI